MDIGLACMHVCDVESDINDIVNIFALLTWLWETNQMLLTFNYFLTANVTEYAEIFERKI